MPCDYKNYPKNWLAIRLEILGRASRNGTPVCECYGECGRSHAHAVHHLGPGFTQSQRCPEMQHYPARKFQGRVVLTLAHLCHKTKCPRRAHIKAMCQACHNRLDRHQRAESRSHTISERKAGTTLNLI